MGEASVMLVNLYFCTCIDCVIDHDDQLCSLSILWDTDENFERTFLEIRLQNFYIWNKNGNSFKVSYILFNIWYFMYSLYQDSYFSTYITEKTQWKLKKRSKFSFLSVKLFIMQFLICLTYGCYAPAWNVRTVPI